MSVVYFAQEGDAGAVKVGWTNDISERLTNLAVGNSRAIKLLCTVRGGASLEAHIHDMLAPHRLRGEWFSPAPAVLDLIEMVKLQGAAFFGAGYVDPDIRALFAAARAPGTKADIAKMQEMVAEIADLARAGHSVKARTGAVAQCLGVSWNRALEFMRGKARKVEAWEMDRAHDALIVLSRSATSTSAKDGGGK